MSDTSDTFRPAHAAALAAADLAGGAALYAASPALGALLTGAGLLVLCGALHRAVRGADPVAPRVPRSR